jgi:hypothetical protein
MTAGDFKVDWSASEGLLRSPLVRFVTRGFPHLPGPRASESTGFLGSLRAGVVVSAHGSARDLKRQPLSAMVLIVVNKSTVERAKRSSRVTTRVLPGSRAFKRVLSCSRSDRAPLAISL